MAEEQVYAYDPLLHSEHGTIRSESAKGFADARYETASHTGETRRDVAAGFGDTRYNIAQNAGDIRRETAEHTNEIIKEHLKASGDARTETQGVGYRQLMATDAAADRIVNQTDQQFHSLSRDNFDISSNVKDAAYKNAAATDNAADRIIALTNSQDNAAAARQFAIAGDVKDGMYKSVIAADSVADRMISQLDKQYIATEARQSDSIRDLKSGNQQTNQAIDLHASRVIANTDRNADFIRSTQLEQARELSRLQTAVELGRQVTVDNIAAAAAAAARDTEIASLKGILEGQKNTTAVLDKVVCESTETRRLINELKYGDLNRELIERNAMIVEERGNCNHWRNANEQNQFAALSSQLQMFNSQLTETRQGMNNFGTMLGVGQSSSANTVR